MVIDCELQRAIILKTLSPASPDLPKAILLTSIPAAQIRTVIVKDLPRNATPSFVASVVYGGPIEWIFMRSDSSATVRFMDAKDCQNYYDDTSNGVVYGKDAQGRELVCFVELGKDVDVIGGLLRGWIDTGVTRCVKAVGVEEEFGIEALRKMGERKGRRVESLEDGKTPGGVSFSYCFGLGMGSYS